MNSGLLENLRRLPGPARAPRAGRAETLLGGWGAQVLQQGSVYTGGLQKYMTWKFLVHFQQWKVAAAGALEYHSYQ